MGLEDSKEHHGGWSIELGGREVLAPPVSRPSKDGIDRLYAYVYIYTYMPLGPRAILLEEDHIN
jgi:hypothetical protein